MNDPLAGVSRETKHRLREFEQFFLKWARRLNLVSSSTLDDVWTRHILDSAQLVQHSTGATKWLDLGSGSGFPGLVLAFLLSDAPKGFVWMVEANHKKAAFLRSAAAEFSLPAKVVVGRIEGVREELPLPQVVTARALAPLPQLLDLAAPWLLYGARGLFHKGRDYPVELAAARARWGFTVASHRSMTNPEAVILEITDLRSNAE